METSAKSIRDRRLRRNLDDFFTRADADGNGSLDVSELSEFLRDYTGGMEFNKSEIRDIFEHVDENHGRLRKNVERRVFFSFFFESPSRGDVCRTRCTFSRNLRSCSNHYSFIIANENTHTHTHCRTRCTSSRLLFVFRSFVHHHQRKRTHT